VHQVHRAKAPVLIRQDGQTALVPGFLAPKARIRFVIF
jgi:hypothetical protein